MGWVIVMSLSYLENSTAMEKVRNVDHKDVQKRNPSPLKYQELYANMHNKIFIMYLPPLDELNVRSRSISSSLSLT